VASGGASAIKEALRNIRRGTPTRGAEEPGAAINVYVGAAQPGPGSEVHGEATDKDPTLPGRTRGGDRRGDYSLDDDDDEEG
jgi:hypothetical protein